MKKLLIFLSFAGLFASCERKYTETITYQVNEPVFMTSDAFRSSVAVTNEQHALSGSGKICFYNGYLYISEPGTGIHIVDNRDPATPRIIGFIELQGNADLAIRNKLLYADAYSNLVWFDISDPAKPVMKDILENAFPEVLPPFDNYFGYEYDEVFSAEARKKGIIVGWKLIQKTKTVEQSSSWWGSDKEYMADSPLTTRPSSPSVNGVNGSMSRFTLYKDYLYAVINNQMSIISLAGENPVLAANKIHIGFDVETIFSYKEAMFLGTPTGMLIYSVANPVQPEYCSMVVHIFGCDPVVVENDLAYVTIHSGNFCGQNSNELFIVDVSDLKQPKHIVSYAMTRPKGLGIDRGALFVCDDGLKIFDAQDPQTLLANRLVQYSGMDGYDLIPFDNVLMMIAEDGIYQYDYSDLKNIYQISKLAFGK
jgi:hypothetical protein